MLNCNSIEFIIAEEKLEKIKDPHIFIETIALQNHFHLINLLITLIGLCWSGLYTFFSSFICASSDFYFTFFNAIAVLLLFFLNCLDSLLVYIYISQITFHAKIFVHNVYVFFFCAIYNNFELVSCDRILIYWIISYIFHRLYQNQIETLTQKAQHDHS